MYLPATGSVGLIDIEELPRASLIGTTDSLGIGGETAHVISHVPTGTDLRSVFSEQSEQEQIYLRFGSRDFNWTKSKSTLKGDRNARDW